MIQTVTKKGDIKAHRKIEIDYKDPLKNPDGSLVPYEILKHRIGKMVNDAFELGYELARQDFENKNMENK